MKKLFFSSLTLGIFMVASLGTASFQEEGPYLEVDDSIEGNFFVMDVEDMDLALEGNLPDLRPCEGVITSGFGWRRYSRRHHKRRMHKGMDIAGPSGTPIFAPASGRVVFVGPKGGYGRTVVLDHGGSVKTLFAHNSKIHVKEGQTVHRGQLISAMGRSGRATGPHLHYEVRVKGVPVNPNRFF